MLLGLAGALLLTQISPRARAAYYTLVTSPILMPGVIIGISTVLFWDRVAGALRRRLWQHPLRRHLPDRARPVLLHRRPIACWSSSRGCSASTKQLMEAALDLGATHTQAFRQILLPFLRPAIFSAAVIAFLASFENYNTSVFTLSTTPRSRSRWRRRCGSGSIPR